MILFCDRSIGGTLDNCVSDNNLNSSSRSNIIIHSIMEIAFDLSSVFTTDLVRLDAPTLKRLNPRKCWAVQKLIDEMGRLSSDVSGVCFV